MTYIATLVDIKEVKRLPPEIRPYVEFKAQLESRELTGNEKVAIFNIATTTAYIPVFLDEGKSIEKIKKEIKEDGHASINPDSLRRLRGLLH